MIAFIDAHRGTYGVEPIARLLPIAPSVYHEHAARGRDPDRAPARQTRDSALCQEIRRVFDENFGVYGVRKVWRQMLRDGTRVARCTVARLMRQMGLKGVVRGKAVKTTVSDKAAPCPLDRVNRQFRAPVSSDIRNPSSALPHVDCYWPTSLPQVVCCRWTRVRKATRWHGGSARRGGQSFWRR